MPSDRSAGPGRFSNLGRYTHRVGLANSRLLACENGRVRFRWKDYRARHKGKAMTLDAGEFIRRFLLHVLPRGFRRIRHFGFLANACRTAKLAHIRAALEAPDPRCRPNGGITAPGRSRMQTPSVLPFLMFPGDGSAALDFYVSVLPDERVEEVEFGALVLLAPVLRPLGNLNLLIFFVGLVGPWCLQPCRSPSRSGSPPLDISP